MRYIPFLLLLTSCFAPLHLQSPLAQSLSPKKQKQKIAALQKKLEIAQKEQRQAVTAVETLVFELEDAQLALIRRQLDDYERKQNKTAHLFLDEREALYKIIQAGPNAASFAAQQELDRILRLITERSEIN